jgi:hypothetical protein
MIKSINPLSAALSPEHNFYDNLFKTETLPHVWVSNLITGQSLASHFTRLYSPAVPPKGIPVGHHILSLDPDTPEAIWKSIAYDLLNVGCIVCISQIGEFAKQPLEWYLADLPSSDVAMHLLTSQVDWVEWVEALSETPLTLREALELAELALVKLNDIEQLNIELDSLRRRAKVSEYKWDKQYLVQLRAKLEKTLSLPSAQSAINIEVAIEALIAQKLSKSKLRSELNKLAVGSGWSISELSQLYSERHSEIEAHDEEDEAKVELPTLLENHRLNLHDYLRGDAGELATAIIETAKAMPSCPEFLFTTLLPVSASLIGTSSRVIIKARAGYKQPCIIWSGIVGRSGVIKTGAQGQIINPLMKLEIEAYEQYKVDYETYEKELAAWEKKKDKSADDKPCKPIRKRFLTTDATNESLERIHMENPRGLLNYRDELIEDFKADNAYKAKGRGGDTEKKLSQWGGSAIICDRKEREIVLEKSAISRTGSIQYEIYQKELADSKNHLSSNGMLARWLFCVTDAPVNFIDLMSEDIDTGLEPLLLSLYRKLSQIKGGDYLLSKDAKQVFQKWQHQLKRQELRETNGMMELVYPKMESYTARFALWLHLVNAALANQEPRTVISGKAMEAAVKLAKYFLEQARILNTINSPDAGLTGILLKIQKYAQGKPEGVKLHKLKSGIKDLRQLTPQQIESHCQWLASNGYGTLQEKTYQVVQKIHDQLMTNSKPVVMKKKPNLINTSSDCAQKTHDQFMTAGHELDISDIKGSGQVHDKHDQKSTFTSSSTTDLILSTPPDPPDIQETVMLVREVVETRSSQETQLMTIGHEIGHESGHATVESLMESVVELGHESSHEIGHESDEPTTNPQLLLATLHTILEIIEIHTEPYFEREETISGVVTVCSYEESWEGIERTFELVELSEIEKQEVKRRLGQLGHAARIRQLYKQAQEKVAKTESAAGDKLAQPQPRFKNGDRVRYQHWLGRFGGYVKSGCLVAFDKSKSTTKRYGPAPTEPLPESELVLIERANAEPE